MGDEMHQRNVAATAAGQALLPHLARTGRAEPLGAITRSLPAMPVLSERGHGVAK
jgi:hypothetical protein